jgi:hypothetical protein
VVLESVKTLRAEKKEEKSGRDMDDQPPRVNRHPEREGERPTDNPASPAS